jgi:hypothetical protein
MSGTGSAVLGKHKAGAARKGLFYRLSAPRAQLSRNIEGKESADMAMAPAESFAGEEEKDEGAFPVPEIRIKGALEEARVREVLEKALKKWRKDSCIARLRGTLTLVLEVSPSGKVAGVRVQDGEGHDQKGLHGLLKKAKRLEFSKKQVKSYVHVKLSF